MVFETIGTMLNSFSIFGMGVYVLLIAMGFAIAKGMSRTKESMMMYGIILFGFSMLFLYKRDVSKTALFLTTGLLVIVYAFKFMEKNVE